MRRYHSATLTESMEEMNGKETKSLLGSCIDACLITTLADKLCFPFRNVAKNPIYTVIGLLVAYSFFCIIYIPLLLISYIFSVYGSVAGFLVELNYLGTVTRN